MTAEDALRFVDHEASWCRERDHHEALCLLLPALLKALGLQHMTSREAWAFRQEFKETVNQQQKKCAAHLVRR